MGTFLLTIYGRGHLNFHNVGWSWEGPDQDWLDWQIWPSGRELGSQSQAPGSIPLAPLLGSKLCARRRRTLRAALFRQKVRSGNEESGIS